MKHIAIYSIYKITNKLNNMCYLGKTQQNPEKRWKAHIRDAKPGKSNLTIHNAIRKYGLENFTFEVIFCVFCGGTLNEMEKFLIKEYNSNTPKFGYNRTVGGDGGGGMRGHQHTDETRQKMSLSHRGKKLSEEHRQKLSEAHSGEPVLQFSLAGKFLNKFHSSKSAELSTGVYQANISKCCKGKYKQAGGFLWCYKGEEDKLVIPDKMHIKCPVMQTHPDRIPIRYVSAIAAERITGVLATNISKCCKGKRNTAGGFNWKYTT